MSETKLKINPILEFQHPEKTEFTKRTTVTLSAKQLSFIKSNRLNLSRIVRAEIDRLIELDKRSMEPID